VLLVVVQTENYQNTLTYLQCKVFTAGNIGSDSRQLPVMVCVTTVSWLSDRFTTSALALKAQNKG